VSFHGTEVLKNINLTVTQGVYGVVGENGAGKTTLFRTVLGLQKCQGSISKEGIFHVGYVPQQFDSLHGLNLEETLSYFCSLKEIRKDQQAEVIHTVLETVNLLNEKEKKVRELSGGMLRRLGIAQALINMPELLIMDEPTVGLDPAERRNLREILNNIKQNRIVFVSSHEISELEHLCETIIFLHKGEIVCCKTLDELHQRHATRDLEQIYFEIIGGNR
jgi:ABC-2 type transport system ATP-binding protein